MRGVLSGLCLSSLVLILPGCGATGPPLAVVDFVDLERYAVKWYEIARLPNSFEINCTGVTAEYGLRSDGRIGVVNTCRKGDLDGRLDVIEGSARVADPETNAKLKVAFFLFFEGDYWILELGEDYEYAVVGEPGRRFGWILARDPQFGGESLDAILARLPDYGYDPDDFFFTPQFENAGDDE